MAFTTQIVRKAGQTDRVARNAVELVQYEHDGWTAVRDASKTVVKTAVGDEAAKAKAEADAAAKAKNDTPPSQ